MNVNILIVDDNHDNLKTLNFLIDSIGFKEDTVVDVIKADSGKKALDIAIKEELSLIILDIQMPQMDGFEVATYLQKTSKTKDIPIIFLTAAFKSQEMRDRGLHIGAVDYLLKPIDSRILIPKIKHYIDYYITTNELININRELELKIKNAVLKNSVIESQLHQSEKLAAMGEMIGNIAHQWRQPIAIISMWANNIIADIDMDDVENESLRKYVEKINEQTRHLSQTIDDFRNFFTPNKEKNKFTLKESIDKTMNLLSAAFKTHNIELIEDIKDIEIVALENELTQAILNILKNAKDILITLPKKEKRLLFINIYKKNDNAVIEVVDNGGGVPEDIIDKVFEPYFTTKHKSQGTGIGLYMSQSIITRDFLGTISIENVEYIYEKQEYKGAKFVITLPIEEKE
ncbi:MAG: hybrid sensor histidine kinase/response regulator [Campylobacterota bacterium]|nr:hybrid sensor histidine kinase/response regulator [Campylobacterota bacterium]